MPEAQCNRLSIAVACLPQIAGAEADIGQIFRREAVAGIEAQRTRERRLRDSRTARELVDPVFDGRPHFDSILGVDFLARVRGDGRARNVAEAAQPFGGFGRRPRRRWLARVRQLGQRPPQAGGKS
jgi:hypothetical protein